VCPRSREQGTHAAHRLWCEHLEAGEITLDGEAAHHATVVLRLGVGSRVTLFDGRGRFAAAEIVAVPLTKGKGRGKGLPAVTLQVEPPQSQPPLRRLLTVALAMPKGPRADWAAEKLTELGVHRVVWLVCARSNVTAAAEKPERWQRIAVAAAGQCGRADLPRFEGPVAFDAFVTGQTFDQRWLCDPESPSRPAADVTLKETTTAALLVGPEGGFCADELEKASSVGYTGLRLARWILRVETAAVAGAALLLGAE
jgi:16S rRNA (uracil1498-N3)-methyltransferase